MAKENITDMKCKN